MSKTMASNSDVQLGTKVPGAPQWFYVVLTILAVIFVAAVVSNAYQNWKVQEQIKHESMAAQAKIEQADKDFADAQCLSNVAHGIPCGN